VNGDGTWSAGACAAAIGWKWNCATDAAHPLPMVVTDPLVVNGGVPLHAEVYGQKCDTHVVQRVNVLYSGTLQNNTLGMGVATDNGSEQSALDNGCGAVPATVPTGPGTLRVIPAPRPIMVAGQWACPNLADFQAALPLP
jgi:hypothetical protein